MKLLRRRNLFESIYDKQEMNNYFNNNNNLMKKKMKYPIGKENYINPIIYNKKNSSNLDENIEMKSIMNDDNINSNKNPKNYYITEKRNKKELYNTINHILISNAIKSEITFTNLFKELYPQKINYLEDKSRMQIDLE